LIAQPFRRVVISLAMRLGMLPDELLERANSAQLSELLAFHAIDSKDLRKDDPEADEAALRQIFGNPHVR